MAGKVSEKKNPLRSRLRRPAPFVEFLNGACFSDIFPALEKLPFNFQDYSGTVCYRAWVPKMVKKWFLAPPKQMV